MDIRNNPFAKVFPSVEAAEIYAKKVSEKGKTIFLHELDNEDDSLKGNDLLIHLIVEEVFNFTFLKSPPSFINKRESHLLYLGDICGDEILSHDDMLRVVLFERLVLEEPSSHLITSKTPPTSFNSHVTEKKCICYLFECYRRLKNKIEKHQDLRDILNKMLNFILENAATALKQPDAYEGQNLHQQVLDLFSVTLEYSGEGLAEFLLAVSQEIQEEEGSGAVLSAFSPTLALLQERLDKTSILSVSMLDLNVLFVFAKTPQLAPVLLKQSTYKESNVVGMSFMQSALGTAFNISVLPKLPYMYYEFFTDALEPNIKIVEQQIWTATANLVDRLHEVMVELLRTCREGTLTWLGACLDHNAGRGRLSALDTFSPDTLNCVSDGFMLNMAAVLLRLAEPFCAGHLNPKLLKIDPTYPAAKTGTHMSKLGEATCLVPAGEGSSRPVARQPWSFITECFHMTQCALALGPAVVMQKAQRLYQDIGMLQARLGPDARRDDLELAMGKYLSLRCSLLERSTLELHSQFIVSTCSWLTQVVMDPDTREDREMFSPSQFREVSFPQLSSTGPPTLKCVPEILVENVSQLLLLTKRFEMGEVLSGEGLAQALTCLLVFMRGGQRTNNPHLRAQLAESLECLLPRDKAGGSALSNMVREQLFKEHPHRCHLVESLLDVFVSIEMTGQSVSFEQKFNYRRPMYTVMEYLWSLDEQRQCFKELAVVAEANMEAVSPPLFLRFLNLLMNDAVFLLDEALSTMASLRNMLSAREAGEWESLPPNERQRNENSFVHTGMTARFDNILGTKTIDCLVYLSSEIKSIFCHATLVDRIAAMLNYFLLHLVGPNKKNFKVKDQLKEYMFDPAAIVLNICKIYIQLSDSEQFCAAVSRDGRSYSPQLFALAENVLVRIRGGHVLGDLHEVAEKVNRLADLQQQQDELLAEVPDEFLDPIMSTLMTDPVMLPSSRQIVDRTTIARHLLSDQSDPFNRSPLTMDMVRPATELLQRIEAWVAQRNSAASDT